MPSEVEVHSLPSQHDHEDEVVRWRRDTLFRAGYDDDTAWYLAERRDVDLHRAVELARRGCPPDLAVRILA